MHPILQLPDGVIEIVVASVGGDVQPKPTDQLRHEVHAVRDADDVRKAYLGAAHNPDPVGDLVRSYAAADYLIPVHDSVALQIE